MVPRESRRKTTVSAENPQHREIRFTLTLIPNDQLPTFMTEQLEPTTTSSHMLMFHAQGANSCNLCMSLDGQTFTPENAPDPALAPKLQLHSCSDSYS